MYNTIIVGVFTAIIIGILAALFKSFVDIQILKKEVERLEIDRKNHEMLNEKVFDKIEKKLDDIFTILTKHTQ